ncbi:4112_t:CDS:2 [Ambispora leptoticha]|uniref:4112_t:CDS:1 n=1 Tax=Ambispora leptoticha TaxID=144679 RepID=A0A9N8YUM3_9GLOM|nr:4112_t:CDS:2 [Ambispora leptoticha]
MNRQSIFILAFVFSLLFVSASSDDNVPIKQVVPLLVNVKKAGSDKLIVETAWTGTGEEKDEKVRARLRCFPRDAVTVKNSPQYLVFGKLKTSYEVIVHKKDTDVKCISGIFDIDSFKNTFSFRT